MFDQLPRRWRQVFQGADAQGEVAGRPGIVQIDGGDRHGPGCSSGGGFGHDPKTDACLHHPADRVEAAQLNPQA